MVPLALSEAEANVLIEESLAESFCKWQKEMERRKEKGLRETVEMLEGLCLHQDSVSRQQRCGVRRDSCKHTEIGKRPGVPGDRHGNERAIGTLNVHQEVELPVNGVAVGGELHQADCTGLRDLRDHNGRQGG